MKPDRYDKIREEIRLHEKSILICREAINEHRHSICKLNVDIAERVEKIHALRKELPQ